MPNHTNARYCSECTQPLGWPSWIVEYAPWFAAIVSFSLVGGVYPLVFGIPSTFLNDFTNQVQAGGYGNIAQYFRVMNLGWPFVGGITGFVLAGRVRQVYREGRIGMVKINHWFFARKFFYTRKVKPVQPTFAN